MRAVFGVVKAGVVASQPQHGGCHADADAGFVHHVEHALEAFAGLAHEVAHGAALTADGVLAFAKVQQCVGGATPAAFVVQTCQGHVVALALSVAPSAFTSFLGTMNKEMPLTPGTSCPLASGILAKTKWMMFSDSSCSPAEIHILLPLSR